MLLAVLAALSLLATLRTAPAPASAQGQTRLVLAFYYAWYNPDSFGAGKTPFQPPEPYRSSDAATIQRHVSQARSAGIDGFVQSWYGPNEPFTNGNFQTLLDVAAGSGFKAAVDFEPGTFLSNNDERASALSTLLATHATHPAYLRVDGKPVIFFWANWMYSVDDWAYIRNVADPNHNSIWIAEGGNPEYLAVFDGLHLYNIAWSASPTGIASTWGANTRAAADTYGGYKYWVATAMPGFDDRHLGRGEQAVYRDRAGGGYYSSSFAGAAASSPDMLIITSFNEWAEGSNIEPSVEFGNFYLDLTAQMAATYKAGGIPDAGALPPAPAAAESQATAPAAQATGSPAPDPTATAWATSTPVVSPTPGPDGSIVYEVEAGDSFLAIAARFDVPVEDIYAYNDLAPDSLLRIGQPLILGYAEGTAPEATAAASATTLPEGVTAGEEGLLLYEVAVGDTLIGIAIEFGLTMEELYALNPGLSEDTMLQVGQQVAVGRRPQPASVGGSTDQPGEEPVSTVTATITAPATTTLPPTPTATIAAPVTATGTVATAVSLAAAATSAPDATPPASRIPDVTGAASILVPLAVALMALLLLAGVLFLYIGRR